MARNKESRRVPGAPQSFIDGKLDKYNMKNLSEERRKEISRMGLEARRKNKEQRMFLQQCMESLLNLSPKSKTQIEVLKSMGISGDDANNGVLLMVALFRKGLSGDVGAIRQIVDMMDRLDILKDTGNVTQGININIVPCGEPYIMPDEVKKEIEEAEQDDDDWDDV